MSAVAATLQSIRRRPGGATADRCIEVRQDRGPRRAPGTSTREATVEVYGATPSGSEVAAEAPHTGAGSRVWRSGDLRSGRPLGRAAGGSGEAASTGGASLEQVERRSA